MSESYYEGYSLIGIIAFGMFFLGMSEYYNKGWELSKDTRHILMNSFTAAVVNLVLNFVFVKRFGYEAAAYTTLGAFLVYLMMSVIRKNPRFHFNMPKKSFLKILLSTGLMAIIVIVLDLILTESIGSLLLIVIAAMGIYGLALIISGELKISGH